MFKNFIIIISNTNPNTGAWWERDLERERKRDHLMFLIFKKTFYPDRRRDSRSRSRGRRGGRGGGRGRSPSERRGGGGGGEKSGPSGAICG